LTLGKPVGNIISINHLKILKGGIMKIRQRVALLVVLGYSLVLFVPCALADAQFSAPVMVQADGGGYFSFTAGIEAGQGCIGFGGYSYFGTENVDGGLFVDTFCIDPQPVEPGTLFSFEVVGHLVDLGSNGAVVSDAFFCEGGYGNQVTIILAPTVGTVTTTWSGLKATYR
jgi:hypothetical protein